MKYRPENWENPYPYSTEIRIMQVLSDAQAVEELNVGHIAYEAGADAILKSLTGYGTRVDIREFECGNCYVPFLVSIPAKGHLVFIHDEEIK